MLPRDSSARCDQIKVMVNGGCVSPTDELNSVQFTVPELHAAVEEAAAQGKYVMAHTYTAASMTNCLDAGARTLEHGNFISNEVAGRMALNGAFLVPTIATYELLALDGRSLRVSPRRSDTALFRIMLAWLPLAAAGFDADDAAGILRFGQCFVRSRHQF